MSAETQQPITPSLSPRAGIAMLTLQIRAVSQEAESLEQRYVEVDHDSAKLELRNRLEPLIAERTRSFTEAIDAAREQAAATIAAAERDAEIIREERRAAAAAERAAVEEAERIAAEEAAALAVFDDDLDAMWQAEPDEAVVSTDPEADLEAIDAAEVETPEVEVMPIAAPAPVNTGPSPFARTAAPLPPPQQIHVSIDAEAFAKVFATVFAAIVEQRLQHAPPVAYPTYAIAPAAPVAPAKQGFWRHARHPDVLLLGVATAIVLVVLAAWLA